MKQGMAKYVTFEEYLAQSNQRVLFDVRTPAEFEQAHIPGAVNLPLFSNEERAAVGTIYKQQSPELALLKGLDFAGTKMSSYVSKAIEKAIDRRVGVYCWRGGKRSASLGWLLEFADFDTLLLQGGYKAYRRYVRETFDWSAYNMIVLGGQSGSGKTHILHQLKQQGEQIIDLENLANHRGSTFGMLGQAQQPTTEQFDNLLQQVMQQFDPKQRIWVENESRTLGQVYILDGFWKVFSESTLINLEVPTEHRIERLVREYAKFPLSDLVAAFQRIEKRLGGQHLKKALAALAQEDFETAAAVGLRYYDKTYAHSTSKSDFKFIQNFKITCKDVKKIATSLIQLANENHL